MKTNQLKAGAALSYISMGIGYIISIIYTPIMLRLLGQSEYGLYNLVASVVAYLGVLNFGFGSAYMRYYLRYKVKEDRGNIAKLNGMFLIIFSVIGLIAVVSGTILALNAELVFGSQLTNIELSKAKILIMIIVINLAVSFPNIVFTSYITANEKFVFQKLVQIIRTVINPFVVLPILIMGYGSVGMVITSTVLNISIEIINMVYCIKKIKMRFSFKKFDFKLMKEMTVFSSFIFLHMIMDQVLWNVDKFILGRLWGTTVVAVYALAAQLNSYYLSFSTAISSVFVPRVNSIVFSTDEKERNKLLTDLMIRVGRIQFIILSVIMLGLIFFGKPFIHMWAGENYKGSYPIVLLLIVPVTLPLIQNLGIAIQRAKNMQKFLAVVNVFIALLNVIISIPLAKAYGGVGSALGTAIAMIIGNLIITNWYYHYRIGLNMKQFWKETLRLVPSMIPNILVGILLFLLLDLYDIKYFILSGFIFVIIYCFFIWRFGMNKSEKDLIVVPLNRIRSRIKTKS